MCRSVVALGYRSKALLSSRVPDLQLIYSMWIISKKFFILKNLFSGVLQVKPLNIQGSLLHTLIYSEMHAAKFERKGQQKCMLKSL